jgi:hypothetical protein
VIEFVDADPPLAGGWIITAVVTAKFSGVDDDPPTIHDALPIPRADAVHQRNRRLRVVRQELDRERLRSSGKVGLSSAWANPNSYHWDGGSSVIPNPLLGRTHGLARSAGPGVVGQPSVLPDSAVHGTAATKLQASSTPRRPRMLLSGSASHVFDAQKTDRVARRVFSARNKCRIVRNKCRIAMNKCRIANYLSMSPTTKNIDPKIATMSATTQPASTSGSTAMLLNDADRSFIRHGVFSPRDTR